MNTLFIDIESTCLKLGIDLKSEGKRLVGSCPFHAERRPSFNVYTDTNTWYCFSCKQGGDPYRLTSLLMEELKTWSSFRLWYFQDETPKRIAIRITPSLDSINALLFETQPIVLPDVPLSDDPFLASLDIRFAPIGYFAGRHIIPVHLHERLVAFEARDFTSVLIPKTIAQPPSAKIHSFLWNIDNIQMGESIIVVEGIKGAIAVLKFGYPNVVSSFGASLSSDQAILLATKQPSEVIIAYDADAAGEIGTSKAIVNMIAWTKISAVTLPPGTDPWDVSLSTWNSCLENREFISVEKLNKRVLQVFFDELF